MRVEVRPITKDKLSWAPSEDLSFKRPQTIQATVRNGRYIVGIPEQRLKELQEKTGLDLSLVYNVSAIHPFWDETVGKVKLENNTMFFDLTDPLQEIQVGILKGHAICANSPEEFSQDLWPEAEFVIYDNTVEVEQKAKKADKVFEAGQRIHNMDPDTKKAIILIILGEDVNDQTDSYIAGTLLGITEKHLDRFLDLTNKSPDELRDISLVTKAIDVGVLTETEGRVYFNDVDLGYGQTAATEFLSKSKNSKLRESIQGLVDQLN